jgi:hypothetical protein
MKLPPLTPTFPHLSPTLENPSQISPTPTLYRGVGGWGEVGRLLPTFPPPWPFAEDFDSSRHRSFMRLSRRFAEVTARRLVVRIESGDFFPVSSEATHREVRRAVLCLIRHGCLRGPCEPVVLSVSWLAAIGWPGAAASVAPRGVHCVAVGYDRDAGIFRAVLQSRCGLTPMVSWVDAHQAALSDLLKQMNPTESETPGG